jgi:hypothetical protein
MESKAKFDEEQRIQNIPTEKHQKIPIVDESCRVFREMVMGVRPKDGLVVGIHLSDCGYCQRWYSVYKEEHIVKMEGFNLWGSGEPEPESDAERETRLLNIQLYQETFNH